MLQDKTAEHICRVTDTMLRDKTAEHIRGVADIAS